MTENTTPQVLFRTKSVAVSSDAEGIDPRTDKSLMQTVVITYADNQNHAIYLNIPLEEAKRRFEKTMVERSDFEIEEEGWDAEVSVIAVADEILISSNLGNQAARINDHFMGQIENMGKRKSHGIDLITQADVDEDSESIRVRVVPKTLLEMTDSPDGTSMKLALAPGYPYEDLDVDFGESKEICITCHSSDAEIIINASEFLSSEASINQIRENDGEITLQVIPVFE